MKKELLAIEDAQLNIKLIIRDSYFKKEGIETTRKKIEKVFL